MEDIQVEYSRMLWGLHGDVADAEDAERRMERRTVAISYLFNAVIDCSLYETQKRLELLQAINTLASEKKKVRVRVRRGVNRRTVMERKVEAATFLLRDWLLAHNHPADTVEEMLAYARA